MAFNRITCQLKAELFPCCHFPLLCCSCFWQWLRGAMPLALGHADSVCGGATGTAGFSWSWNQLPFSFFGMQTSDLCSQRFAPPMRWLSPAIRCWGCLPDKFSKKWTLPELFVVQIHHLGLLTQRDTLRCKYSSAGFFWGARNILKYSSRTSGWERHPWFPEAGAGICGASSWMDLSGAKVNAAASDPHWDAGGRFMCASLHELSGWVITPRQAVKAASGAIKLMETRMLRKFWKWMYYLYSGLSTERAALSPQANCC